MLDLESRLRGMLDKIKPGRSNEDVVYEIMLKLGQDLCEPVIEIPLESQSVELKNENNSTLHSPNSKLCYGIGADIRIIVCLALNVTVETAEAMAEYAPGRIIFADQCFDNLNDKSNVKLTLKNKKINIKVL